MTHDTDCPARYGCCPNDEYGCTIHTEPPCNCARACLSCGQDRGHWSDYCTPCCLNGKADEHATALGIPSHSVTEFTTHQKASEVPPLSPE